MAQDTTPALVIYPGQLVNNTYRTNFEFAFDKGFYGEVKVAFVRRGLTEYHYDPSPLLYDVHGYLYAWNGGVYTKTETATTETPLYDKDGVATGDMWTEGMYREPKNDIISNGYVEWRGNPITENDIICIVRETQKSQPYTYPNNQKHIERALDNLSRQIQELQLSAENALHVDPAWNYTYDDEHKMDPIAWLQTIVRSKGLTLRELRIDNDYIEYTTDDPDSLTKTWNVIAGVKAGNGELISHFRETKVLAEDGITWIPFLEYSTDGGNSWKVAGREAAELEHQYVKKAGDTMTGTLWFQFLGTAPYKVGISQFGNHAMLFSSATYGNGSFAMDFQNATLEPRISDYAHIGTSSLHWADAYINKVYTGFINNGYDIAVPVTNSADTLALKSEVDLAANSGDQLTNKGVWYAKMYAATVAPSAEDGTNYADFSQTDQSGNPIIVLYERQNGAWVQTDTITPPAEYNGYVTVTSKIWDIVEQEGQQGGKVLWSHNTKTFTPYPQIISFENAALTGNSTVQMPTTPTNDSIVNKGYVDSAIATSSGGLDLFDTKWKDYLMSNSAWALSDGNWKTSAAAYAHLADDFDGIPQVNVYRGLKDDVVYCRDAAKDANGEAHPYAFTSFYGAIYKTVYCDVEAIGVVSETYDGPTSAATLLWTWGRGNAGRFYYRIPLLETIDGTEIRYFVAGDGHKIVMANQEASVSAIYAATGVAWYYMLDTTNQRFKLPRAKYKEYITNLSIYGRTQQLSGNIGASAPLLTSGTWGGGGVASGGAQTNRSGTTDVGQIVDAYAKLEYTTGSDQYKHLYFYIGQ